MHVKSTDTTDVQLADSTSGLQRFQSGSLSGEYLVYRPSSLPLEDFFARLANGDYNQALEQIHLVYRPATTDNEALRRLLAEGFIPAYVRVNNAGTTPVAFSQRWLTLQAEQQSLPAIAPSDLPSQLKKFNGAALSANIYNTTVVVIGAAAVLAAAVYAANPSGLPLHAPSVKTEDIYNPLDKTTTIHYHDYLLAEARLAPGQHAAGLVFFRTSEPVNWEALRINMTEVRGASAGL